MKQKYIVIEERIDHNWDIFESYHDTLESANTEADRAWSYLTDSEKKKTRIHVELVREDCLNDWAYDDDTIDWSAYHSLYAAEGAFDSAFIVTDDKGSEHDIRDLLPLMGTELADYIDRNEWSREDAPQKFLDAYCSEHWDRFDEYFWDKV